ncbi:MAG: 50S ribosomal protein L6 [Zetaproteobacteria bacterium CG12_big_fil_rev_8_21_14_0_65_55_1124]|nr:MAG: 50S ribosomal protein L6 [Zetaproteobacteria bacterium CG1_02_55_237]PIS18371.1 MAG: 50S ribosomal protein L6 [Zetaproteobacteria bacterium CG08_land_8_20_14_0_20_55_17]PIW43333.1 MAG: 50S ribosomal protein L6 [Zetaproteobacteria bacterium CG12_big_fil_rev_8_21_14_0_65_55_1124]PIY52187.1 MAG: 50S ribosomal protein L6 [Zetaproteobacteria bacterium CG_4_10_14_0_8_um_filter_55_43]PIZ37737.1 MAG: 50S ribosomal protein L6 [Zetaproteobacteria bacterium CG_4_10_14_0_2_um_filter_55_20]PJB79568
MSRIGKQPINLPSGVTATLSANSVTIKGPKGEMSSPLFAGITIELEGNVLQLSCSNMGDKVTKSKFGLARALLANVVTGVSKGFEKVLELRGVGYRAQVQGKSLNLALGFSHPVVYEVPQGVEAMVEQSRITLSGIDKQKVGQAAAEIRAFRPPEPYKGKGVRYVDEHVNMKEGKKA